jgi:hypothetical protein
VRANFNKNLNLTGFYTLSFANGNNNGSATDAYDLDKDYGRAGFVTRNMLFMMGNYTGPWGIRFNPFMIAQSGRPYNITLPTDPLNNFFNQRPTYATASTPLADQVTTQFGVLDDTGLTGATIPVNLGSGPAAVAVNLRVSKAFGIGPKLASATTPQPDGGPPPGGPPQGWAGVAVVAAVAGAAALAEGRWPRRSRRNGRRQQHRPQVLAHLQRSGVEPLQRHRQGNAERNIIPPARNHRPRQSIWKINQPGRWNLLARLGRAAHLRASCLLVLIGRL